MSIEQEVKDAIENAIEGAVANVEGGGGHFVIDVISDQFAGKRLLEKQRLVYSAIAHLMAGDAAPVHAVDQMTCRLPEQK